MYAPWKPVAWKDSRLECWWRCRRRKVEETTTKKLQQSLEEMSLRGSVLVEWKWLAERDELQRGRAYPDGVGVLTFFPLLNGDSSEVHSPMGSHGGFVDGHFKMPITNRAPKKKNVTRRQNHRKTRNTQNVKTTMGAKKKARFGTKIQTINMNHEKINNSTRY